MTTPLQSVPAADKGTSDAQPAWFTKGDPADETSDSPITPLQADPAYPQHRTYTPSDSEPSTAAKPSAGPESGAKHAQQDPKGAPGKQAPPVLEGRFDQVNTDLANSGEDSNSSTSGLEHSPQQQRRAVDSADGGEKGDHAQAQLSPPQSCPSTPASQIGTAHGSDDPYRSVTHVNSCFAKSDDEGEQDDILSSSSSRGSQHVCTGDEASAAVTGGHTDEEDQSLSMRDKMQSCTAVKAKTQVRVAGSQAWHACNDRLLAGTRVSMWRFWKDIRINRIHTGQCIASATSSLGCHGQHLWWPHCATYRKLFDIGAFSNESIVCR